MSEPPVIELDIEPVVEVAALAEDRPGPVCPDAYLSRLGARRGGVKNSDAEALLTRAEQQPGVETRGIIGRAEEVGVMVVVVETMDELFLAFSAVAFLDPSRGVVLFAAFGPEGSVWTDWRRVDALPTRALGPGETCFSIVRG